MEQVGSNCYYVFTADSAYSQVIQRQTRLEGFQSKQFLCQSCGVLHLNGINITRRELRSSPSDEIKSTRIRFYDEHSNSVVHHHRRGNYCMSSRHIVIPKRISTSNKKIPKVYSCTNRSAIRKNSSTWRYSMSTEKSKINSIAIKCQVL